MRLFRGTRRMVIYEDVEVFAEDETKAIEMIEDDHEDVKLIRDREGDYELDTIDEVKI